MYSTCLHCTKPLGTNDVIETLPIGRRIAFDAAQGRLWVVCRRCTRWNLVPFDTRLESIDAAERQFREARMRFSTDNVGLARLREGLELVRIGPALRPEFAAWRYGDSFGRRRYRALVLGTAGTAATLAVLGGTAVLGMSFIVGAQLPQLWSLYLQHRVSIRVPRADGAPIELTTLHAGGASIVPAEDGGWGIRTQVVNRTPGGFRDSFKVREETFAGDPARRVLSGVLAHVNQLSGSRANVRDAVARVEHMPDPDRLLQQAKAVPKYHWGKRGIGSLNAPVRLALEMSLNEDHERTALQGELKLLEWQWREAERLAKIADDLVVTRDA